MDPSAVPPDPSIRKAAWILSAIIVIEGGWMVINAQVNGWRFVRYLGVAAGHEGTPAGWVAALAVAAIYVLLAMRLPSVRAELIRPSWLKVLAILIGITAGTLEEVMFRRWIMNYLQEQGHGVALQVLGSGAAFGLAHGIWGLLGSKAVIPVGPVLATGLLGTMLGIVFVLAGRSLLPCIASHFLINAFIEPGLVLAAARGEMRRGAAV